MSTHLISTGCCGRKPREQWRKEEEHEEQPKAELRDEAALLGIDEWRGIKITS